MALGKHLVEAGPGDVAMGIEALDHRGEHIGDPCRIVVHCPDLLHVVDAIHMMGPWQLVSPDARRNSCRLVVPTF
jgi:hypothetical protein